MITEYTITTNGSSSGNVIQQPFKVKVHALQYGDKLTIGTCTEKDGNTCTNDDIAAILTYDSPAMTASKNADLAATLEVLLQEKYPGNWS